MSAATAVSKGHCPLNTEGHHMTKRILAAAVIIVGTFGSPTWSQCETWKTVAGGTDSNVLALAEYNGKLIVGGGFTTAGGVTSPKIASWNGQQWTPLGGGLGPSGAVSALAVYNGKLIAGGSFNAPVPGGQEAHCIAQWNGTTWQTMGSGMSNMISPFVSAMAVYNGELYAGGIFSNAGGVLVFNIARWNGSQWAALGSGTNGWVKALAVYNGELIAAGSFTIAGGQTVDGIARWNGSNWQPLGPDASTSVFGMTVFGTDLIVGGAFGEIGGIDAQRVARWDGSNWFPIGDGFQGPGPSLVVECFTVSGGELIAGGVFSASGATSLNNLARWDGSHWQPLDNGVDNKVYGLSVYGNQIYSGGTFAEHIARWHECCPTDLNHDDLINVADLLGVINSWGICKGCAADITGDGTVNSADLLSVINAWGACP